MNLVVCKGVELELVKLEGLVEAIHENLRYLKDRLALTILLKLNYFYLIHGECCICCIILFKKWLS